MLALQTIDFEKRQAKGFSSLDITEEARNRALEMALEDDAEAVNSALKLLTALDQWAAFV
jgi:AAA+ superfamily predicted ATPase